MENNFYSRGQSDCLKKLPANPGQCTPTERNDYTNGYNSVKDIVQRKLFKKLTDVTSSLTRFLEDAGKEKVESNSPLERVCINGLEASLRKIKTEKYSPNETSAESFFFTSFSTLYSLNPGLALSYAGKYNTAEIKKMGPEDLIQSFGKLLPLAVGGSSKLQGDDFQSSTDLFTDTLLDVISINNYTPRIVLPDEFYLKFVQALSIDGKDSLAKFKVSGYNELQKALSGHRERRIKQISEIGSKFKYGISLEQTK